MAENYNVLFLCAGNSARSIMAEVILANDGGGRFNAFSAGSQAKGIIHPMTIETLAAFNYPTTGLGSKSWDVFAGQGAPEMDFVFTVCDEAAGEVCPVWPGQPISAHWGIADPALVAGELFEREAAFSSAFRFLKNRIDAFVNLPIDTIDRVALHHHLREIGRLEGATLGPKVA